MDKFIPYSRPEIDQDDISAVALALRDEMLTGGAQVTKFEHALANLSGAKRAVACSSGTAALHLAALALDLPKKHCVIVPSNTFVATANCVRYIDREVIFADVDPTTGLITPETLEIAVKSAKTMGLVPDVVIPVHYAGQVANIFEAGQKLGLRIIEDASHALGSTHNYGDELNYVGSCSDSFMTTFSFHPVKNITSGEGGAILTNCEDTYNRLNLYRSHGIEKKPSKFMSPLRSLERSGLLKCGHYEMPFLGFNYRLSDINAALGSSQIKKLENFSTLKKSIVSIYNSSFGDISPFIKPLRACSKCNPSWHLYVLMIDFEALCIERSWLMNTLFKCGIGTQVHYIPVHQQPYYKARYGEISLPGADLFYKKALSLPLYPSLAESEINFVVDTIYNLVIR